jgi:hypothetical protein
MSSYTYTLLLPGLRNLQLGGHGLGTLRLTSQAAGIAATSHPSFGPTTPLSVSVLAPSDASVRWASPAS